MKISRETGRLFSLAVETEKLPWHKDLVERGSYDVLGCHVKWNAGEYRGLLGNDARFFTAVRDPVERFESLFGFRDTEREKREERKDALLAKHLARSPWCHRTISHHI